MGGKNKPSQRTKNNARPSSSGRSAEMLGNAPVSFIGFSGVTTEVKTMPLIFPMSADTPNNDLSTEYLLVIKKLNKKDPITKTKALQEMSDLIKESRFEEVTNVLPYWCRLYRTLTNDTEHKVREETQTTHGIIVAKCGRTIAPYLKQIIPIWLTAQYDNFAPAASSAQTSLQGAFPESKLPEVISFCKAEMMTHIISNLIGDPQAAFNSNPAEPDVAELRYQRLMIGTLHGFDFFAKHLPDKHNEWLWMEQLPILDSGKFWKLSTDKCAQIRGAWFRVIARQIERYPDQFGEKYGSKATKVLVNNLIEKDPLVAVQLWECFLLLTARLKNWYSWVDKKEQLSKRILDMLENGGWGNATHLAAVILPLLANLPAEMRNKEFYSQFFVAMIEGLNKKAILASKSHRQACITSIGECLKYVSLNEIDTFAVEIITSALRKWLEKILEHPYEAQTRSNIIKYSATVMVSNMKYWLRQSKESKSGDKYDQLVRNFWQNKCSTIVNQIEKVVLQPEQIRRSIEGHLLLLQTLKTAFSHETKKRATIKFETDEPAKVDEANIEEKSENDIKMQETYSHNLNKIICTICSQYLQFADEKEISLPIFNPLYTLLSEFNSRELFIAIAKNFSKDKANDVSLYSFYDGVFRRWLSGDTMRCKEVVHMTFLLVPHMSGDEQEAIFKSFNQFVPSVIEEIISMCLSHPYSSYEYVQLWMKSEVVDITLAAICKRLVKSGDSHSKNLLLMSFSQDRNGDIIISEGACSGILLVLCEALQDVHSAYLDMCASLASQLLTVLLAERKTDAYKELLLQMFKLTATVHPNEENLSKDTWWELKTSWQDGLSTMDKEERTTFIENGVKLIHQTLVVDKDEVDTDKVDDVIDLVTSLMCKNFNAEEHVVEIVTIAKALFDEKGDINTPMEDNIEAHSLKYDCLNGRLNFLYDDREITKHIINTAVEEKATPLKLSSLSTFLTKSLTRAKFLSSVVLQAQKEGDEDDEDITEEDVDKAMEWSTIILSNHNIQEEYCKCLHDYTVLHSLDTAYSFWPHHNVISANREIIGFHIKDINNLMSSETEEQFLTLLSVKASTEGFYWAYTRKTFQELIKKKEDNDNANAAHIVENNSNSRLRAVGDFHCLHVSCESSSPEVVYRARGRIVLHCFHVWHHVDPASADEPLLADRLDYDKIVLKYNSPRSNVAFDIMNASWSQLVSAAATMDAFTAFIGVVGLDMSEAQWDTIALTLCSYLRSVDQAKLWWGCTKSALIVRAALSLLLTILEVEERSAAVEPAPALSARAAALVDEWTNVVRPDVAKHVHNLVMAALETPPDTELGVSHVVVLRGLSEAARRLGSARASADATRRACLAVLAAPTHHALKYLAYYALKGLVRCFAEDDLQKLSEWCTVNADKEEVAARPQFSITAFDDLLTKLEEIVDTELMPVKIGEDSCVVVPFTDSYSMTLSYLLLVELALELCASADSDVQQQYIEFFRSGNHIELVMSNCMRLLPAEVIERAREPTRAPPVPQHIADMFTAQHTFTVTEAPAARHVAALACRCVLAALGGAGAAAARGWHGALAGRLSKTVDGVVAAHVAPAVLAPLFAAAQDAAGQLQDVTVTVVWSSYEVMAEYTLDETRMGLQIKFSANHPLGIPKVESLRTPVNHSRWISFYLSYQNGTIVQAIRLWLNAVARKVEASSPCYVCYSRLHPQTGQLPRVHCSTCNNRFHSNCIYKWFRSSSRASCPLCRSLF